MNVRDVLDKYGGKIESQMSGDSEAAGSYSREYMQFREEMSPELSRYERWCYSLGSIIKLKPSKKDEEKVAKYIRVAHLNIEPWQALNLGIMSFLFIFFIGIFISVAIMFIGDGLASFPIAFFILSVALALAIFYLVNSYPARLANKWRLKASSQMVPAILYVVVYMRHTPNLERAISFAAKHLDYPLSLDFKKVFYDVEVGRFSSINESLDNYLEIWRDYSSEFIEGFHLLQSSLFEPDETRRIATLEKSLQVVLDGVYDKMLKFTHDVRSPLTNVYMLGVVLPTLGLALLPLASAMVGDIIRWYHVLFLFNIIIPILVFYMTDKVLLLRPGGHGETTLLTRNKLYNKYKSNKPYFMAFLVCFPLILISLLPLIFEYTPIPGLLGIQQDYTFEQLGLSIFGSENFFHFAIHDALGTVGPFGFGALILGMLFPLGIALFFWMSFNGKTKEIIKERSRTKQLEKEFNNSLFQLGNRIGNGMPPELVFGQVAESSKGLITEDFFRRVNYNIRQMGMGVEDAIFDKTRGAISYYPSDLISTSMRILIESSKKGLRIAAVSLMSISEYVKNMHKITSRLRDMLAEIISDMKSNMTFLAPLLSGIVVGLAAMITAILMKLDVKSLIGGADVGGISAQLGDLMNLFDYKQMIPPYFLQIVVGIYLIEIIFILTRSLVVIDAGEDKLEQTNKTGKNLLSGVLLYFITAMIASIALFFLSTVVLGNII